VILAQVCDDLVLAHDGARVARIRAVDLRLRDKGQCGRAPRIRLLLFVAVAYLA
jgi:hypothetical protein